MFYLSTLEVVPTPFQWGPYILIFLGIITAVGGYFIKRLINALDKATESLSAVQVEVAVVKSVITSTIEFRLDRLENPGKQNESHNRTEP